MTVAEFFKSIGDAPLLAVLILVIGVPVILWVYRDLFRWILWGSRDKN